ncbi:putative leader peptide [Streptomyces sp. NBC_00370]
MQAPHRRDDGPLVSRRHVDLLRVSSALCPRTSPAR